MTEETMELQCLLPLKGVVNFRDMGGLATLDGRRIKKGILFRAAELTGLTEEDKTYLETLNLKYVFDYRDNAEADRKPDPMIGQAKNERIPAHTEDQISAQASSEEMVKREYYKLFTKEMFINLYAKLPIQNASYKRLMTLLKNPEENLPLVHHCTGGRDRTGVGAMLILLTLGVPYETVVEDFLLSNHALEDFHNKMFDEAGMHVSEEGLARFRDALLLQEDYLKAAIDSIVSTYGDFETYLSEELGITQVIRERIRDYCLD
ncbi:tyrosine-protein phosphatase [Metabacillus sp. Hm71]|uniref:tyrosine-protein phosphatase n=1 Tax=Metabacillus sp. Hm71 TaxID=3450743 RepID=UPI003F428B43